MNICIGARGNVDVQAANIFRGHQHSLGTIDDLRTAVGLPSIYDKSDQKVHPRVSAHRGSPNIVQRRGDEECVQGTELECFRRLVANDTLAKQMHKIYMHVNNTDPYIAMVGEEHAFRYKNSCANKKNWKQFSSMGMTSTFAALDQLKKIRDGDHFWYENN
jgi:hypothetical protein